MKSLVLLQLGAIIGTASAFFEGVQSFGDRKYDLTALSTLNVRDLEKTPPTETETNWYFSPSGEIDKNYECPAGSQVCGIKYVIMEDKTMLKTEVIPVAGDFNEFKSGVKVTELPNSGGIHVSLTGGQWGSYEDLSAELDFICDKDVGRNDNIKLISWDGKQLKIETRSPFACPQPRRDGDNDDNNDNRGGDKNRDQPGSTGGGVSFGSIIKWMFIIGILLLVFVFAARAFIDYRRYGVTGLDLLPQSDTIRDLPYLVRDFFRKIANTFAGGPSRGGYSAV